MVNWKVRVRNKAFWIALVPALLVLVQALAGVLGIEVSLDWLGSRILDAVNALFVVLSILGIVNDPTTDGLSDSKQAMGYTQPRKED